MKYTQRFIDLYKEKKVDEITMVKMSAFKEEIEGLLKESASFKDILMPLISAAVAGTAITGVAAGLGAGMKKYITTKDKRKAEKVFKDVYQNTPGLQKFPEELVKKYFNSLLHFSPKMATDPISAKSWLLQTVTWDESDTGIGTNFFQMLADTQQKVMAAEEKAYKGVTMPSMPIPSMSLPTTSQISMSEDLNIISPFGETASS